MKFSRLSVLLTAAVVATSALASASKAHALTYNLVNVTFDDDPNVATATGSFDYDPATTFYSNISILYSGSPFTPNNVTFNQTSFFTGNANALNLRFSTGTTTVTTQRLDFNFTQGLGGSSSDVTGNYIYSRVGTSTTNYTAPILGGSQVSISTVPFNIPGGATIPAVGGLLALGLMRKARKSLASNTRISRPISEVVS